MRVYNAVVEDIDDPIKSDRVRVRVFGLHTDDKNLIPTESLPWAQVMKSTDSASISGIGRSSHGLVRGSWVKVIFEDDDMQYPFVLGSISGVSTNPNMKASYEEVAFETAQAQIKQENYPEETKEPTQDTCEANVNLDGFYSEFGKSAPNTALHVCCDRGINNPYAKIAILSIIAAESKFVAKNESFKYTVKRIREVFPTKTSSLTDYQLADLLKSEEDTANFLYGNRYGNAKNEGYLYRGRGYIQTTYKANYEDASKNTGVDLVASPDLINSPGVIESAAVSYIIGKAGGTGQLNGLKNQEQANRLIAQLVLGKNVSLNSGYGSEYISKVKRYSDLGYVIGDEQKATPIGNKETDGSVSDGLSTKDRFAIANSNVGFKDPTGKYPLLDTLNEPDTNRLTRRNTDTNVFKTKKSQRRVGIRNVGGEFSQPEPPYNTKYPYNRGYFSESGHALEFDDTDSQERISMFHKSGTFYEVDSYGNKTHKIVGNGYVIVEKNGYVYVDGTLRITAGSNANVTVIGNVNMTVDGSYNLDIGGDLNISSGGDISMHCLGKFSARSNGNSSIDGARIDFNYGASKQLSPSQRDPSDTDYPQILGESVEASEMITVDDMSPEEADSFITEAINSGKVSKVEVDKDEEKKPTEQDTAPPVKSTKTLPGNCEVFSGRTSIPKETVLSRYFSLADLTTNVAIPSERREVKPHLGKSVSEIVCNLKKLAENCLDPIMEKYPDMIITNALRVKTNGSQHNIGQAADLQFTTAKPSDYYDIAKWIKDNVPYDQLILEYRSNGRPWIHISFSDATRYQVMTFMNHKKHSSGLSQLG